MSNFSIQKNLRPKKVWPPRPVAIDEIRRVIGEAYRRNRWDRLAQLCYHTIAGVRRLPLEELNPGELETILNRMQSSRMLIFEEHGV